MIDHEVDAAAAGELEDGVGNVTGLVIDGVVIDGVGAPDVEGAPDLPAPPAVPITVAPAATANCTIAVDTPDPAAFTSTTSPGCTRPTVSRACHAVM